MTGFGRPTRRRWTWLELGFGGGIVVVVAVAARAVLGSPSKIDESDMAVRDAQRIRDAALEWREANPQGCPTLTQLKHEHRLASEARTDDPWGGRFRLACSPSGVSVVSPGRDGTPGTDDDVKVPRS
jgi:hypothetical protein